MKMIVDILAVVGGLAVAFAIFAGVAFIRQISKNGWNN